jgi:inner membrane protein
MNPPVSGERMNYNEDDTETEFTDSKEDFMDTATHFAMGFGLYGLAHLDPAVAAHPETAEAVLWATVIGSQAPDFDGVSRFKGSASYIRHHRGWTHSLPMLAVWPTLITGLLAIWHPAAHLLHVFLWSAIAVAIHVGIDLFNSYGTQAWRPFSQQWVKWHVLNIFDPFIMGIHLLGFLLWESTPVHPGTLFALIYLVILLYIGWRWRVRQTVLRQVIRKEGAPGHYTLVPTIRWNTWSLILEEKDRVRMGEWLRGKILWTQILDKCALDHPAVKASRKDSNIQAFLYFSDFAYPQVKETFLGYEVRWVDVRYHTKKHFPFQAIALLDHHCRVIESHAGWMTEQQLEKKLSSYPLKSH